MLDVVLLKGRLVLQEQPHELLRVESELVLPALGDGPEEEAHAFDDEGLNIQLLLRQAVHYLHHDRHERVVEASELLLQGCCHRGESRERFLDDARLIVGDIREAREVGLDQSIECLQEGRCDASENVGGALLVIYKLPAEIDQAGKRSVGHLAGELLLHAACDEKQYLAAIFGLDERVELLAEEGDAGEQIVDDSLVLA